ncbi:PREDICTED: epididymal-specific lipocalin-12 isoform X1 [Rhinopithecus bieti]|uniref:epididymal-specific lipocalin-12 isoform X1 n=1 Tax=Rhinopithecus bieti TaxID=61621 RepID=UPI00083C0445|nr:PREDICTED: epididymal-specific lipocalin-12 isoform X1 [Rhinopithecus bieti]XP_017748548.1 PREDICTED: epididymal-specific lipocalin-12 isoform X1 [Rhinopithecus bieti]
MRLPCGLWLWLSLLKVLQGQTPSPPPLPPPVQNFQGNQFQGEWFVLGLAGNSFRLEHRALLNPFTATFELSDNGRFEVWNAMTRGQHCDTWSYVLIPAAQPGQFTVDHGVEPGADREETRVVDSDYTQFALMLSRRHTSNLAVLRISLLGRSWLLPPGTLDQFICLSRAQGLSDDNIVFPDVTGNVAHLRACWALGTGPAGVSVVDPRGVGLNVCPGSSVPACTQGSQGSWVPALNPGSEPPPPAPGPLSRATSSCPRSPVPGHLLSPQIPCPGPPPPVTYLCSQGAWTHPRRCPGPQQAALGGSPSLATQRAPAPKPDSSCGRVRSA